MFQIQLTLRSELSPMIQEGVNAKEMKCDKGNQNHTCVNTNKPTTVAMCVWPARDCNEIVTFRPPVKNRKKKQNFRHTDCTSTPAIINRPENTNYSDQFGSLCVCSLFCHLPASRMPWARVAPNLAIISSCLSPITLA